MPGLIDAHVILVAVAIAAIALLTIGVACVSYLVLAGHWRAVREAEQAEAERAARRDSVAQIRRRVVVEFRAAETAREKALRQRQARRQHEAIMRNARTELLRQDLNLKRVEPNSPPTPALEEERIHA